MKLFSLDANESLPLYCRYKGEFDPQPAHLEIDLNTMSCRWNWCGRFDCIGRAVCVCRRPAGVVLLPCSPAHTRQELRGLEVKLAAPLAALFDEVEKGGRGNIAQGPLLKQIRQTLESSQPAVEVMDAWEWRGASVRYEPRYQGKVTWYAWIGDDMTISASTSDSELQAISDRLDKKAMCKNVRLLQSQSFLRQLRRNCA